MQPINRKERAKRARMGAIFTGIGIFYISLHAGVVWDGTPESINQIMTHALTQPFDVQPIAPKTLGIGAMVAVIVMLMMYQNYLNRRKMRPNEESGSAGWNEDLKKYYRTFADTKQISIPKPKGKGILARMVKDFLTALEKALLGFTLKVDENTGGEHAWDVKEVKLDDGKVVADAAHHGTKNMIFTNDVVMSMNTRKTMRNNNVMVVGGSGTGKSRFMIKPNMLQANCSYVVADPSGELLASMGTFLKEKGYALKVFNLTEMQYSNSYNPFNYVRDEKGVLSMINALIQNTTPKGATKGDPFWEKSETALLQAICFYLIAECNPEDQNFTSVMKLLRCAEAAEGKEDEDSVLDILFKELEKNHPDHIGCRSYAIFKSAGGGKTAQSILISCQTRLQVFNLQEIHRLTGTDNIDLKSVGDRPTALFCITPVGDSTYNFLVALLYTQLFETLYFHAETECDRIYHRGPRLPVHVRFMLDEFANIGTIPDFNEKLSTMRKYEISCTIVIQALSQLQAMYKDDWEVLMGNCDSTLFLGGSDKTTLEYFSNKLGKETIRIENTSRTFGKQGSSSASMNTTARELMQPDELGRMDNKNCIIFIRGEKPFFSKKYKYERHPNYKYTEDADKKRKFDVRDVVQTAELEETKAEKGNRRRQELRERGERTNVREVRLENAKKRHLQERRQQEKAKELLLEKEAPMKMDVGSMQEAIEKNRLSVREDVLEEAFINRYSLDEDIPYVSEEFDLGDGVDESGFLAEETENEKEVTS